MGPTIFLRLAKLQGQHCFALELLVVEKHLMVNFYLAHEENVLGSLLISEENQEQEVWCRPNPKDLFDQEFRTGGRRHQVLY